MVKNPRFHGAVTRFAMSSSLVVQANREALIRVGRKARKLDGRPISPEIAENNREVYRSEFSQVAPLGQVARSTFRAIMPSSAKSISLMHGGPMSETQTSWLVLCVAERRVLGVLVEKAKTTPDAYPMSLNGLVAGSNQKSNREPVLDLSETEVEDALVGVQQKGLTTRISGGRVEKTARNPSGRFHACNGLVARVARRLSPWPRPP